MFHDEEPPINLTHHHITAGDLFIVIHDIEILDVPDSTECIHLWPASINDILLYLGDRQPDIGFPSYSMIKVLGTNGIIGWIDEDCVAPLTL